MKNSNLIELQNKAKELGFHSLGVVNIPIKLRKRYYKEWIERGMHGSMKWMERNNDRRLNPENLIPEAKSIIVCAMNYYQPDVDRGYRIAKYALGKDYHTLIYKKLKKICVYLRDKYKSNQKPYVDTGPILEKPIAEAAGIGWQGKSTIIIEKEYGTWSFLGTIVTTLDLKNNFKTKDYCGSCTRCIDFCPTKAITEPYKLDASKCIAYLTIEHEGPIPVKYREAIADRLFGCDTCLDVCPWNKWAKLTKESHFEINKLPKLSEILNWTKNDFDKFLAGTPLKRLRLDRLKRNALVVIGNTGTKKDLPLLIKISKNEDSTLREHARWSINAIKCRERDSFS